ncbi:MAG: cobalamin biosynthesis protein [Chloroflexota bacterium]
MDFVLILILAVALDLTLGEPPRVIHPVVGMGKVISFLERGGYHLSPRGQFWYGALLTLVSIGLFVLPTYWLLSYLKGLNQVAYIAVGAVLLKTTFAVKELRRAGNRVKVLLKGEDREPVRRELRALVKRDTSKLSQPLIVSATVESLAENTADSLVAPLFYFLFFGVPGAVAYRVANTLDAMIGYHGKYEYLGKFAARLDDVLNLVPARITGVLLVLAVFLSRGKTRGAWQTMLREHGRMESPNAGWTISAVAGGLGISLEKVGHYRLGEGALPLPEAIEATQRLVMLASLTWVAVCLLVGVGRLVFIA